MVQIIVDFRLRGAHPMQIAFSHLVDLAELTKQVSLSLYKGEGF